MSIGSSAVITIVVSSGGPAVTDTVRWNTVVGDIIGFDKVSNDGGANERSNGSPVLPALQVSEFVCVTATIGPAVRVDNRKVAQPVFKVDKGE